MSGVAKLQRPRVVYFNRAAQTLRVGGKRSYSDFSIRVAGGQNVAAEIQAANAVTIEQVLTWNPQMILLGNFDTAVPSDIYDDPRWQGVDAVRNRRVYKVPLGGYRWDPPSQESAAGMDLAHGPPSPRIGEFGPACRHARLVRLSLQAPSRRG